LEAAKDLSFGEDGAVFAIQYVKPILAGRKSPGDSSGRECEKLTELATAEDDDVP